MSDFDYSAIGKTSKYIANEQASAKKDNSKLDQADFLKLLTTQLTNQDPSQPVDNNQMVGTMSQLSIVDNLSTITSGMDNVVSAISSSSVLSATSLVGRCVLAETNKCFFDGRNCITAQIDAGDGASDVKIRITDSNGSEIASYEASSVDGKFDFAWDGIKDPETGETYPAGSYQITATGFKDGESTSLPVKSYATVGSVIIGNDTSNTKLNLIGVGEIALSKVEQVAL